MMTAVKRFARWVYEWVTIIAAALVGGPALLLDALSFFEMVDLSPFVGAETALKIVTVVAIVKAILAFIASRRGAK